MGEIKRMNLGGEPMNSSLKQSNVVDFTDLTEFARYFLSHIPRDLVILKGGFVFGEVTGAHRYTADVDFSLLDLSSYEMIKVVLAQYGDYLVSCGKCNRYKVIDEVVPGRLSGGAEYYNADGSKLFSVDISGSEIEFDTIVLDITGIGPVVASSAEQMLSDKLAVLFSRKRFRRIKDLLDAYTICNLPSIDLEKVKTLLTRRGIWPLPADEFPFRPDRTAELAHAYEKFRLRAPNSTLVDKPEFDKVVTEVCNFLVVGLGVEVMTGPFEEV